MKWYLIVVTYFRPKKKKQKKGISNWMEEGAFFRVLEAWISTFPQTDPDLKRHTLYQRELIMEAQNQIQN